MWNLEGPISSSYSDRARFQKEEGMPQQVVFLLPILEGLEAPKK